MTTSIKCSDITYVPSPASTSKEPKIRTRFLLTLVDDDTGSILASYGWDTRPDPKNPDAPRIQFIQRYPTPEEIAEHLKGSSTLKGVTRSDFHDWLTELSKDYDGFLKAYQGPTPEEYAAWLAKCPPIGGVEHDFPNVKVGTFADPLHPTSKEVMDQINWVVEHWKLQLQEPGQPLSKEVPVEVPVMVMAAFTVETVETVSDKK